LLTSIHHKSPADADVLNALGTAAAVEGRFEDSLTYWKQALAIDPHRERILRSAAITMQNLGRNQAARPMFEKYLELQPWNASMWTRYSVLLDNTGETDAATAAALKSMELDPSNPRTSRWLAEIYGRKGDEPRRRRYFDLSERLGGFQPDHQ
jgi:tetratricopeptide (TPR) repeat protein